MKTVKRIFSLLLVASLLLALVACSSGSDREDDDRDGTASLMEVLFGKDTDDAPHSSDTDRDPSTNTDFDPSKITDCVFPFPDGSLELEGNVYIVLQHQSPDSPFGYRQDSMTGAYTADRIVEVQDKYGCVLVFDTIPFNDSFVSQMQSRVYAEHGGDLVFTHNNSQLRKVLGTGGETSYMVDLHFVSGILDFWNEDLWGSIAARESMMAGGTFYGVIPALWQDYTPMPYYQVVYNKSLLERFGCEDPQEYWEAGRWNREAMMGLITACYDPANGIWGMSATVAHMAHATYLSTETADLTIEFISEDGAYVRYSDGMTTPEAAEALQWLKTNLAANGKYFNNGQGDWATWTAHQPYIQGRSAFCVTRPQELLGEIVRNSEYLNLIPWAGKENNVISGFYEACAGVAIPIFAQNDSHSAYLMYDLFQGLSRGTESREDIVDYYRNTYFETDLDVKFLLMDGANLQYSYWPNGLDPWNDIGLQLMQTTDISALLDTASNNRAGAVSDHYVPNQVVLEKYRSTGYFR